MENGQGAQVLRVPGNEHVRVRTICKISGAYYRRMLYIFYFM